jgi:hypothetical protein
MKNSIKLILFSAAVLLVISALWLFACSPEQAALDENMKLEIIHYTEIPRPYSTSTYFLYGAGRGTPELRFADGNVALILQKLLEKDFDLREAWNATGEWGCPLRKPTWEQMIIRLAATDLRIYDFGFTSDSSRVQIFENPACRPTWEHYRVGK